MPTLDSKKDVAAMVTRRGFVGATAVGGVAGLAGAGPAAAGAGSAAGVAGYAGPAGSGCAPPVGPVRIRPDDPRYVELTTRGYNGRFTATPDTVHLAGSTDQVVQIVEHAVRAGKQLAVRSGGHCFDNLVDNPAVRVLLDLSEMKAVYYDPTHRAFAIEAGATLGQVYRTLYLGWGVTIPAGEGPGVGAGGHILGGGYGRLSRRYGLVVDHLYAVEVVVVDRSGHARAVTATRNPTDPNHDLWWAHTGGGGGNYGIVTRYWLRTPGNPTTGNPTTGNPATLLPVPPATLHTTTATWSWNDLTPDDFTTLLRNHAHWHEHNDTNPTYASLHSRLELGHQAVQGVALQAQLDGTLPDAEQRMTGYLRALTKDVKATHTVESSTVPWLQATLGVPTDPGEYDRLKSKAAYLRKGWSDRQIGTVHRYLTDPGFEGVGMVQLFSLGGKVNTVPSAATATAQRDSVLKVWWSTWWGDPQEDAAHLEWIRAFYRDVHADTGGVPVPGAVTDGSFINYPDTDLADPRWNTSGTPWHTLYYKDNYPRLQQIKARWDPRNVFHHALSIRPPQR